MGPKIDLQDQNNLDFWVETLTNLTTHFCQRYYYYIHPVGEIAFDASDFGKANEKYNITDAVVLRALERMADFSEGTPVQQLKDDGFCFAERSLSAAEKAELKIFTATTLNRFIAMQAKHTPHPQP